MKTLALDELKHVLRAELKSPLGHEPVRRVSTDSRDICPGDLFVALHGPRCDGHDFIDNAVRAGARAVVMDVNIPPSSLVKQQDVCLMKVADTRTALADLARYYRRTLGHSVTVIAVTGSNGKTTTREMIYHVLCRHRRGHCSPASYNNGIGVPLTLLGIESDHDFAVVEIGTSAPGEVAALARIAAPDIAVITQVAPAHLQGLKDIAGVSAEKASIVAGLGDRGVVVCNAAHRPTLDRVRSSGRMVISFGVDIDADVSAHDLRRQDGRTHFRTNDRCDVTLPLGGRHNVSNALAALATVRRLGVTTQDFARALQDFVAPPGRMTCRRFNGITVIDDTYNANPASMAAALDELTSYEQASRRVFICGDMAELGDASVSFHQQLGRHVAAAHIDLFLTVGPLAARAAQAALEAGRGKGDVQRAISSRRLARLVKSLMRDGDLILVKGSRCMQMELVVDSLSRWRRAPAAPASGTVRLGRIEAVAPPRPARRKTRPLAPR